MKKFIIGLALVLSLGLVACGKETPVDDSSLVEEDGTSQATFSNDKALAIEEDGNKFYIDNPTQNDSEYFFTKIKFLPADKKAQSAKFELVALYEGSYITSFKLDETLDGKDEYIFEVRDEFENILPSDELEKIDFSQLEFDIENLEVK